MPKGLNIREQAIARKEAEEALRARNTQSQEQIREMRERGTQQNLDMFDAKPNTDKLKPLTPEEIARASFGDPIGDGTEREYVEDNYGRPKTSRLDPYGDENIRADAEQQAIEDAGGLKQYQTLRNKADYQEDDAFGVDEFDVSGPSEEGSDTAFQGKEVEGEGDIFTTEFETFSDVGEGALKIRPYNAKEETYKADGTPNTPQESLDNWTRQNARAEAKNKRSRNDFKYNNTETFREAYKNQGPVEVNALLAFATEMSVVLNEGMDVSFTKDGTTLEKNESIFRIMSKELNAQPLSINNAFAETSAFAFVALLNRGTLASREDQENIDWADPDDWLAKTGIGSQVASSVDASGFGLVGVESEALENMLGSMVNSKLRQSEQTKPGTGPKLSGIFMAKALVAKGYMSEEMYQPRDYNTGAPKGPAVKSYMFNNSGSNVAKNLMRLDQGIRNRVSAVSNIGDGSNDALYPDKKRAGQPRKDLTNDLFWFWSMINANASLMHNTEVLALDNIMLSLANQDNPNANHLKILKDLSSDMLNITPFVKSSRDLSTGEMVETPRPTRESPKSKKVQREIKAAQELARDVGVFKNPNFSDPSSNRVYYPTFNANPQESIVHRGSLTGIKELVNIPSGINLNSSEPIVSLKDYRLFEKWRVDVNDSTKNGTVGFVAQILALSNLTLTNTRDYTDKVAVERMTGVELSKQARKGMMLRKLIASNLDSMDPKFAGKVGTSANKNGVASDPKISFQGFESTEVQSLIDMLGGMTSTHGTGDQKEHGIIFQGYMAAADLVEAINKGQSDIRLSIPYAADQNSAARMFMAAATGEGTVISLVGYGMDNVVGLNRDENSHLFPLGNPRFFYIQQAAASLRINKSSPKGYAEVNFSEDLNDGVASVLSKVARTRKGPQFADMMAKTSLMITEYGKAVSQNTEEVQYFLKKTQRDYPEVYKELVDVFEGHEYDIFMMQPYFEEAMYRTTLALTDPMNSRVQKKMTQVFALMNEMPTYVGIRGASVRIGRQTSKPIPDYFMEIQIAGEAESQKIQMKGEPEDDPQAVSPPKWIPSAQKWHTSGIASAAANSFSPAVGHSNETAVNALATLFVAKKFNKSSFFLHQTYDSVTMNAVEMAAFTQYAQTEAVYEVTGFNDAEAYNKAFEKMMEKKWAKLEKKGTMNLGVEGEYSGWTKYWDEAWSNLNEPRDPNVVKSRMVVDKADLGRKSTAKELLGAYKRGLWQPEPYQSGMILGEEIIERGVDEVSKEVPYLHFKNWYDMYVNTTQFKDAKKKWSNEVGSHSRELRNRIKLVENPGWFMGGRARGATDIVNN